jgi:TolB protein
MVNKGLFGRFVSFALVALLLSACNGIVESPGSSSVSGDGFQWQSEDADPGSFEGTDAVEPEAGGSAQGENEGGREPDLIRASGLIMVTGRDGELTLIDSSGTRVRQLRVPSASGPSLQPTWGPLAIDGGQWVAWSELAVDGSFQIALADPFDGTLSTLESPVAPFYYYWSADGNRLGFLGQTAFSPLQMGVVDVMGNTLEMVGEGQPFYFDWRPDSHAMVIHADGVLSILTYAGGTWEPEALALSPGQFQAPAWVSGDRIVVTVPALGGEVKVGAGGMVSAQGDLLPQRLVVIDPAGRFVRFLADLEGPAAFVADPDGRRVAYTDYGGPLQVIEISTEELVSVTNGQVAAFQWSNDGERLLFMEVDPKAQTLVPKVWDGDETLVFPSFLPTRVFLLQYLPFWDQYSRSLTLWSPAGDAFTYPAGSTDGDRIMVQHLNERQPIEVSKGVFASWSPAPLEFAAAPDP